MLSKLRQKRLLFLNGGSIAKQTQTIAKQIQTFANQIQTTKKKKKNIFFHSQKKRKCSLFVYYESFHVYYILSCIKYKNIMNFMEF